MSRHSLHTHTCKEREEFFPSFPVCFSERTNADLGAASLLPNVSWMKQDRMDSSYHARYYIPLGTPRRIPCKGRYQRKCSRISKGNSTTLLFLPPSKFLQAFSGYLQAKPLSQTKTKQIPRVFGIDERALETHNVCFLVSMSSTLYLIPNPCHSYFTLHTYI